MSEKKKGIVETVFGWTGYKNKNREVSDTFIQKIEKNTTFQALIQNDIVDERRKSMAKGIEDIGLMFAQIPLLEDEPAKQLATMQLCLEMIHSLYFNSTSPWMRSMENRWLAEKFKYWLDQCERWKDLPEAIPRLIRNGKFIMNLSFTNKDIVPLPPIFLNTISQGSSGLNMNQIMEQLKGDKK